jgi:hypothetical protein
MKHIYIISYKNWSSDADRKTLRIVSSSIDKAIIGARKSMKKSHGATRDILSVDRQDEIHGVE